MSSMPQLQEIIYPESDGKPMADNTKQFEWILTLGGGLLALFEDRPDVFVAGDLLWYPKQGHPEVCAAPDAMVVFGRPKGYRGSYRQWEEENIPPQVTFEILSPGNSTEEMSLKRDFYERHGVQEYYIYDPDILKLTGWIRRGVRLEPIAPMRGWVSPLLDLRFEFDGPDGELKLHRSDGKPFAVAEQVQQSEKQREQAELRAEYAEHQLDETWQKFARFGQYFEQERLRAEQAEKQLELLLAQLKAKGIELEDL
ncbi:MAG: Uma2 family endonuclease [Chloroflexi bacterium]|nr:Uma2 family endonuclease [Chloroflexota bacterium]